MSMCFIHGLSGASSGAEPPDKYKPYVAEAKTLYTGEYDGYFVSENPEYINVGFIKNNFLITSYNSASTEFRAYGWYSCRYNKGTSAWETFDFTENTSTGWNYISHFKYLSPVIPSGTASGEASVYGFTINESESNPTTSVTYTDGATSYMKGSIDWDASPLFKDIKPCLFKDGAVVGYLQKNDYSKFEDGTSADITSGNAGDVMVEIPKMAYYMEKSGSTITAKVFVGDGAGSVDSRYSYLPFSRDTEGDRYKIYIGAYLGYNLSGKLRSLSGKTPTGNQSIGTFRTQAQANGTGYQLLPFYPLTLLQILYILKYGSLDSQTALGRGYVDGDSAATTTGGTNAKGFCFGETTGKQQMKIFGIEDFWGNLRQWIDGLYSDSNRTILTTYKSFNDTGSGYPFSNSSGLGANTGGYMTATQGGTQTGFTLKAASGSETTYYADGAYLSAGCLPVFGGFVSPASYTGAFHLFVNYSASRADAEFGARLCYI